MKIKKKRLKKERIRKFGAARNVGTGRGRLWTCPIGEESESRPQLTWGPAIVWMGWKVWSVGARRLTIGLRQLSVIPYLVGSYYRQICHLSIRMASSNLPTQHL